MAANGKGSEHWVPFQSSRLLFTPASLDPDVVNDIYTTRSFESVYKWSVHPRWTSHADAEAWIASKLDFPRSFTYTIQLLDRGDGAAAADDSETSTAASLPRHFGTIGLAGPDHEVGYQLHPAAWGRGYATEALTALVSHVFSGGGGGGANNDGSNGPLSHIAELVARIGVQNGASRRVLGKCGFVRREGDVVLDNDGAELECWAARRGEWPAAGR